VWGAPPFRWVYWILWEELVGEWKVSWSARVMLRLFSYGQYVGKTSEVMRGLLCEGIDKFRKRELKGVVVKNELNSKLRGQI
jgi:hypothetical protein